MFGKKISLAADECRRKSQADALPARARIFQQHDLPAVQTNRQLKYFACWHIQPDFRRGIASLPPGKAWPASQYPCASSSSLEGWIKSRRDGSTV